jgi:hypothetical protein
VSEPVTLLDIWREVLIEVTCQAVADQGVEIHQWLRDEKARSKGKEPRG